MSLIFLRNFFNRRSNNTLCILNIRSDIYIWLLCYIRKSITWISQPVAVADTSGRWSILVQLYIGSGNPCYTSKYRVYIGCRIFIFIRIHRQAILFILYTHKPQNLLIHLWNLIFQPKINNTLCVLNSYNDIYMTHIKFICRKHTRSKIQRSNSQIKLT